MQQRDSHGKTLLHIAAMRDSPDCTQLLLQAGMSLKSKAAAGWLAMEDALCYNSRAALTVLSEAQGRAVKQKAADKLQQLGSVFAGMPDCAMQVPPRVPPTLLMGSARPLC